MFYTLFSKPCMSKEGFLLVQDDDSYLSLYIHVQGAIKNLETRVSRNITELDTLGVTGFDVTYRILSYLKNEKKVKLVFTSQHETQDPQKIYIYTPFLFPFPVNCLGVQDEDRLVDMKRQNGKHKDTFYN